jgi:DNA-binding response OmpR family regulator
MLAAAKTSGARVVVVDREPEVLRERIDTLRDAGFDAVGCTFAAEALSSALVTTPAVVIIDMTSGDLDGFALALELRGDHRTHHIPIIGMISAWSAEVRARAARAGICVLLLEPCVHEHLLAEVRRALHPARQPVQAGARPLGR